MNNITDATDGCTLITTKQVVDIQTHYRCYLYFLTITCRKIKRYIRESFKRFIGNIGNKLDNQLVMKKGYRLHSVAPTQPTV